MIQYTYRKGGHLDKAIKMFEKEAKAGFKASRPTSKGAGMTEADVRDYRRKNPGSKLKTAVTGKVKKGSKAAKRRASYCRRSLGQMKMHNINCSKTPEKRICAARRRWRC